MSVEISLACVAVLLGTAVFGGAAPRHPATRFCVYASCFGVAVVMLVAAARELVAGAAVPSSMTLPLGLPWMGAHFRIDRLSAFFLVVVNLGAGLASLYGLGYGRHEHAPGRVLPFFPAFLAGMNMVVLADDAFSFLLSWEFMSLGSWALVMAHHREPENSRAAYIYLLMASFGTLALLLGFGLLAGPDGAYGFAEIRAAHPSARVAGLVLALALLGAGSKAGLVPLHVWLPLAHPAAPSHVSALMSGIMTKVAVYGFVRIVFDLLGPPAPWWSMVVLALAGITAVLGVLYALMEHDLKRLLAYHTVENIGIIFIGLGLALAFQANDLAAPAALALTAALLHVFNHSLFKSLLFFGSGAVLVATGERDMEHLGGLIHRMPVTAFTFLIGSAAISALPPLNGFASEWLTFQAILLSPQLPQWGLKFLVPAVGGMLALSAALAAACFVKAFGMSFLGRARRPAAAAAQEVDRWSLAAMLVLSLLCVLVGIFPGLAIDALAPAIRDLAHGARMPVQSVDPWFTVIPVTASRSSYNGLLVLAFIILSASLTAFTVHRLASRAIRRSAPWDCGYPDSNPITQYTAGSFAQPIRRVFGTLAFAARERVDMPLPGELRPARLAVQLRDLVWDGVYRPIAVGVGFGADQLNHLQFLTIRRYLSLVFVALVFLLTVLALWQ